MGEDSSASGGGSRVVDSGARGHVFDEREHSCMLGDRVLRRKYEARAAEWIAARVPPAGGVASLLVLDIGAGPFAVQAKAAVHALAAALQRRPVRGAGGGGGGGVGGVYLTIVTVEKDGKHSRLAAAAVHAAIKETGLARQLAAPVEVVELPGFLGDPPEHQLGEAEAAAAAAAVAGGGGVGSSAKEEVLPALRNAVRRAAAAADARAGVPGSLQVGVFHELFGA